MEPDGKSSTFNVFYFGELNIVTLMEFSEQHVPEEMHIDSRNLTTDMT